MVRCTVEEDAFARTCGRLARVKDNTILALRARIVDFTEIFEFRKHGKLFLP
jgi:hypothetical protein